VREEEKKRSEREGGRVIYRNRKTERKKERKRETERKSDKKCV
jgi:hypothetical protein